MPASPIVSHQNPLFHEKLALKASFFLLFGITIAMAQETTLRSPDFRSAPIGKQKPIEIYRLQKKPLYRILDTATRTTLEVKAQVKLGAEYQDL